MQRGKNEGEIHTTCTVCRRGLDLRDGIKCDVCKNYVHKDCYNYLYKMCDDCAK